MRGFITRMGVVAMFAAVAACDTSRPEAGFRNDLVPPASTGTSGTTGAAINTGSAPVTSPTEPTTPPATAPTEATAAALPATADAAPRFREVTIPAGTVLPVRLASAVASDSSRVEQRVDGTLTRDVRIGGAEALGAGASLRGVVTNVQRSGRVKGRASVGFRFNNVSDDGRTYAIRTATVSRVAPATKKRDAATIGIPAAGGAIIGGIVGGKKGAVKGGAIGGVAGTTAVLTTRGKEVRLAPGQIVSVRLTSPLTVRIPQ